MRIWGPGCTLGLVLVANLACGTRTIGVVDDSGPSGPPVSAEDLEGRIIETFVEPLEVVAGGTVTVNCVVSKDREHLPGVPTAATVEPDAGAIGGANHSYTFTPTIAGTYRVRCKAVDDSLIDERGVEISVIPAAPAAIDTLVPITTAEAGAPVAVACEAFDAYGNEVDVPLNVSLEHGDGLDLDPPAGESFTVRGTMLGTHEVHCRAGDIVDPSVEQIEITAGIPGQSETSVDVTDVLPTENVSVSCTVADAFANPLDAVPTSFMVLPDKGSSSDAGLSVDPSTGTFSATKAGTYFVFCQVPGFRAADESPAVVTVHPGMPHHWVVELPEQDCFWQDRGLPLYLAVYDRWDNEIDFRNSTGHAVELSSPAYFDSEGVVRIPGEGDFDVGVCMSGPLDAESTITACPSTQEIASIRIDSTPPAINITSPARSAMISQGTTANTTVSVSGNASDTVSTISQFEILGNADTVSGTSQNETHSVDQTSRWGLNIVTGSATDECGNRRVLAQSYLRSQSPNGYFTASTTANSGARAGTGILAHLNQQIIDDYIYEYFYVNPTGAYARARGDLDDIVTILQRVLDTLDFDSLLAPNAAFASDGLSGGCDFPDTWADTSYWVGRPGPTEEILGSILVNYLYADTVTTYGGGMGFDIDLNGMSVPIRASACARECVVGVQATQCTGNIDFRVNGSIATDGFMTVALSGTSPSVAIPLLNVNATDLNVSNLNLFDCGVLNFLCDPIEDLVETIINGVLDIFESQVEDLLESVLRAQLPSVVGGFLSDFGLNSSFALPAPFSLNLNISSAFDRIVFGGTYPNGYGELGLYTQIFPSSRGGNVTLSGQTFSIPAGAGAIRKDGSLPSFSNTSYAFGLGLKDDLVNQILWALWYGGALNLNLAEIAGLGTGVDLSGVNLSLFATEPPVIMPGTGGGPGARVDIGLGDAYIDATVDLGAFLGVTGAPPLEVGLYLSAIVGGNMTVDNPPAPNPVELAITLDTNPTVYAQVVRITDEGYQGVMSDLFTELLGLLLPEILSAAVGSFPIPDFDLAGLAGLPAGTVLRIRSATLTRPSSSYFRVTGSLQQ